MQKVRLLLAIAPAALVAALAVALRSRDWPLGVRGEWEWLRLASGPAPSDVLLAGVAVLLYAGFAALGLRALTLRPTRCREGLAVGVLMVAAVVVQTVVPIGAPEGYGLARWALVLHLPASTGYYTVAKKQIHDRGRFLAEYPELDSPPGCAARGNASARPLPRRTLRCSRLWAAGRPSHAGSWITCPDRLWRPSAPSTATSPCPWPTGPRSG